MPGHYNSSRRRGPIKKRTPAKPVGRMTAAKKASTTSNLSGSMSATPRSKVKSTPRAAAKPSGRVTAESKASARKSSSPKSAPAKLAPAKSAPAMKSKFGVGSSKTIMHNGKELANVTAEQLKNTGMSLREYMNSWNKSGSRPTKAPAAKKPKVKMNPGAEGRAF